MSKLDTSTVVRRDWQKQWKSLTNPDSCPMRGNGLPCEWADYGVQTEDFTKYGGVKRQYNLYVCSHCKFSHEEDA